MIKEITLEVEFDKDDGDISAEAIADTIENTYNANVISTKEKIIEE